MPNKKYKVVERRYTETDFADPSETTPEPSESGQNYSVFAAIGFVICGTIGLATTGIFGWILLVLTLLFGLLLVYSLLPEEVQKEILSFFEF